MNVESSSTVQLSKALAGLKRARRILLVEDNQDDAHLTELDLQEWGCEVTRVNCGEDALAAAKATPFDIALVDFYLPTMAGIDTAKYLRKHYPMTVIVMYSGEFSGFHVAPKPFHMAEVKSLSEAFGCAGVR